MAKTTTTQLNNDEKRERQKAQNRERVARCRANKKAREQAAKEPDAVKSNSAQTGNAVPNVTSFSPMLDRFRSLMQNYGGALSAEGFFSAFGRAGGYWANMPSVQNLRMKGIQSLPADYNKDDIAEFLRAPYQNEIALRQTSETLKWTAYPFFKIIKTYQDIPTYRYYFKPQYIEAEDARAKDFKREAILLDKLNKELCPDAQAHRITGESLTQGKVVYYPRVRVDKTHNQVNFAFMTALPIDWCTIIGRNNVSGYTVSFNLMYFMQPGTDVRQYGDLFLPYLDDFNDMFSEPRETDRSKNVRYASISCKGEDKKFYFGNVKANAAGSPRVFEQNGRWFYYVSLPVEKIWVYEIDDTTVNVASPLSGLMITYAQQADYENAQISLLLNPLIKIFTGEIPYFNDDGATKPDNYRLSEAGKFMFEAFFDNLMAANNTSGTAFFSAPVQNIKSHDYPESANANKVASSFNEYATEKSGLAAIIPISDPKAGQANLSAKLEARYSECVYRQFERMMSEIYKSLNLKYEWDFHFFGTIYTEEEERKNANTAIANGDISAHFILAALDRQSWVDKLAMMKTVKESGLLDMLIPPITSYTAKQENSGLPPTGGRPKAEGVTEGNEKSADSGDGGNE